MFYSMGGNGDQSSGRFWRRCALGLAMVAGGFSAPAPAGEMPAADAAIVDQQLPGARILDGGIRFVERKQGKGPRILKGDQVIALYAGRLLNGKVFNQKRSLDHSFHFEVGATPRQIIRGWERAILLMQEGGSYTVAIPAELAYRDKGRAGQVPPGATVIFDIDIIEVERAAPPRT